MKNQIARLASFWQTEQSLSIVLGLLVLTIFIASPLGNAMRLELVTQVAFAVLLLTGLAVISSNRKVLVLAMVLLAVDFASGWSGRWLVIPSLGVIELILNSLFVAALIFVMLARSLRSGRVTVHRISGAVAAYLLAGLLFAQAFSLVEYFDPGSFAGASGAQGSAGDWSGFLYFSMVTLATLGYGDVTPLHPAARSLATLEAFLGQLYPAILISRLVALELAAPPDRAEPPAPPPSNA